MSLKLPVEIEEGEDRLIVDAQGYEIAEATYVEYADVIVRALNSHNDMLAALKELLAIQDMSIEELDAYPEGSLDERAYVAWDFARYVIKNAEEK